MKKHKILVVALALAVMLTGAGYAYWTQTLTIENTVSTGYLDVGFLCPEDDDWDDGFISGNTSSLVTLNTERSADKQKITFSVGNFYPGAGASLDFVVKNTGTVAAKITRVVGTIEENANLCNALNYRFTKVVKYGPWGVWESIMNVDAFTVADLAAGLTDALDDIILQPGEVLVLVAENYFGPDQVSAPGYEILMPWYISGNDFEDQSAKFSLALNFIQVN